MENLGIEVFIVAAILGAIAAYFANGRGRNPMTWFFLGFFFGIFALGALFILKPLDTEEVSKSVKGPPPTPDQVQEYRQKEWFYLDGDRSQLGPVSFDKIEELYRSGTLNSRSYLWCDGMAGWLRIEELPEVNVLLSS